MNAATIKNTMLNACKIAAVVAVCNTTGLMFHAYCQSGDAAFVDTKPVKQAILQHATKEAGQVLPSLVDWVFEHVLKELPNPVSQKQETVAPEMPEIAADNCTSA